MWKTKRQLTKCLVQNWFRCFKEGYTGLKDKLRSRKPSVIEDGALLEMVEQTPSKRLRILSAEFSPSQTTINRYLSKLGLETLRSYWWNGQRPILKTCQYFQATSIKFSKWPFLARNCNSGLIWIYICNRSIYICKENSVSSSRLDYISCRQRRVICRGHVVCLVKFRRGAAL